MKRMGDGGITTISPHAHCWIDPNDPPIERAPYVPIVGDKRRQIKFDVTYECRECAAVMKVTR